MKYSNTVSTLCCKVLNTSSSQSQLNPNNNKETIFATALSRRCFGAKGSPFVFYLTNVIVIRTCFCLRNDSVIRIFLDTLQELQKILIFSRISADSDQCFKMGIYGIFLYWKSQLMVHNLLYQSGDLSCRKVTTRRINWSQLTLTWVLLLK